MQTQKLIGIDIGGTNLRVGVFEHLKLIQEVRFEANFSNVCKSNSATDAWQKILNITAESIQTVLKIYPEISTIGIGFPGFIDPNTSNIAQSPNLPGLENVNLAHDLSKILGKKVIVENDANAAAYGEYCLLNQPVGGLIYLGLGTGVGGGLVLNGKPYVGQHGCAMEIGHIIVEAGGRSCGCGNLGCLEQYASASGISKSYFLATQKTHTAAEIANFAQSGDGHAVEAYKTAANALAQALASMIKVVDVKNVVIGGGVVGAWHLMQATFNARLNEDLMPVLRGKILVNISTVQDIAGMLGAAMLAGDL